jgi:hypothetical protein
MRKKNTRTPFLKLTPEQRTRAASEFDREIRFEETRPLSEKGKVLWQRAKRGPGRPRVGQGSAKVLVTLERGLLAEADDFAKRNRISRSALVARGLRAVLLRA